VAAANTGHQGSRAAIDYVAMSRHEAFGSCLFATLIALLAAVVWSGAAALSGHEYGWAGVLIGLAVGLVVRVTSKRAASSVRLFSSLLTIFASVGGAFFAACLASDMVPLMVLAHWGTVGQEVVNDKVLAPGNVGFYALAGLLAFVLPVVGRNESSQHAR
jgi:hypothetical protein